MISQKVPPVYLDRVSLAIPARISGQAPWKWLLVMGAVLGGCAAAAVTFRPSAGDTWQTPTAAAVTVPEVRLGSRVGGRVAAVHVQAGQTVAAGQVLVTFEAEELTARRDQAQSRLAAAEVALARAAHGLLPEEIAEAKAAAEAARVRLERAAAGPRPEQKRQAQADLDLSLVEQRHADTDFARAERLANRGAASQVEYEAALVAHDRAHHKVNAARAALNLLLQGSRPEEVAEVRAEFERVQAHYELLRRGTRDEDRAAAAAAVTLAQAQLAEAEATLREAVVTASERCVITEVTVRPGSVVAPGQPMIVAH